MRTLRVSTRVADRGSHFFEKGLQKGALVLARESRVSSQQMTTWTVVTGWMVSRARKMCWSRIRGCCCRVDIEKQGYAPGSWMRPVSRVHFAGEVASGAASYQPVVGTILYLPELQGGREARLAAIVQRGRVSKSAA